MKRETDEGRGSYTHPHSCPQQPSHSHLKYWVPLRQGWNTVPDKQKLREFTVTRPALQDMLKKVLQVETKQ